MPQVHGGRQKTQDPRIGDKKQLIAYSNSSNMSMLVSDPQSPRGTSQVRRVIIKLYRKWVMPLKRNPGLGSLNLL